MKISILKKIHKAIALMASIALGVTQVLPESMAAPVAGMDPAGVSVPQEELWQEEPQNSPPVAADETPRTYEDFLAGDSTLSLPDSESTGEESFAPHKEEIENEVSDGSTEEALASQEPLGGALSEPVSLEEDDPVLAEARDRFGDNVAGGTLQNQGLDNPVLYTFYDENGELIGRHTKGGLLGADEWTWADGSQAHDLTPYLERYYERLDELDEIKSGISSQGITVDDVTGYLEVQAQLKQVIKKIRDLGAEVPQELIDGFHETVSAFDELMGNRPLLIETSAGTVEVSVSELMRYINEEFKRLTDVNTNELDRLYGIDTEDMEGLQGFREYLESRSANGSIGISVFKGLSPVGNLFLAERLVRKFSDRYGSSLVDRDLDNDGLQEVNFDIFRRAVNGTEETYREAMRRITAIVEETGVTVPQEGFENLAELVILMQDIEGLKTRLHEELETLAGEMTLEPVFIEELKQEVSRAVAETYRGFSRDIRETLESRKNPVTKIRDDYNVRIPDDAALTFESLLENISRVDDLHVALRNVVQAIADTFPDSPYLSNIVQAELSRQITEINDSLEQQILAAIRHGETELHTTIASQGPVIPSGETAVEDIYAAIAGMDHLHSVLSEKVRDFEEGLAVSDALKSKIMEELKRRAHGGHVREGHQTVFIQGVYESKLKQFNNMLRTVTAVFDVDGVGEVRLTAADLNAVAVPAEIASLLRFPGNPVAASELNGFEKRHAETARRYLNFSGSSVPETSGTLSYAAARFEFTEAFLNFYGDRVVADGSIAAQDYEAYRRALLMDDALELYFDGAAGVIEGSISRARQLIGDPEAGITPETYATLYKLISDTHHAAKDILQLALDDVIHDARQMVSNMLQEKFNQLLAVVDEVANPAGSNVPLRVDIDGTEITINAREIQKLMEEIMPQLAVKNGNEFTREQLERLTGVENLGEWLSHYELYRDRQINFNHRDPNYSRSPRGTIADEEFWFRLIPAALQHFGGRVLDESGAIDLDLLAARLLEGSNAPVERGESIRGKLRDELKNTVEETLAALETFNYHNVQERIRAQELVVQAILSMEARGREFVQDLSAYEIHILLGDINRSYTHNGIPSFRQVTELLRKRLSENVVTEMSLPDGRSMKFNLNTLVQVIKGLHYSESFDRELFPGLIPSDFEGVSGLSLPSSNPFVLSAGSSRSIEDFLTGSVDHARFYEQVILRHFENLDDIPELYREGLFSEGADGEVVLNLEKFRRLLKGIDELHQQVEDQVRRWIEGRENVPGALEELRAMRVQPMTVESMQAMFEAIQKLQGKIMDYLNSLTHRHEKEDVMAMENSLMKIFRKATRVMLDYYQENDLTLEVDGQSVTIPVPELTGRMQEAIAGLFPEESDISAHHYASFYGVSVEDIRGYQKLADFLGSQIIALPRNSQYVYVPAKLSGIGMAGMMHDLISRYADEVVRDNGTVDTDLLITLISDADLAVTRAKERAEKIVNAALARLDEMEMPLTQSVFAELDAIGNELRLELVNAMNDHVSGFSQDMFDQVQEHVAERFEVFLDARIERVLTGPVRITGIDGSSFEIDFSRLEPKAAVRIVMLLKDMESKGLDELEQSKPVEETEVETVCLDNGLCLYRLKPVYHARTLRVHAEESVLIHRDHDIAGPVRTLPFYHPIRVSINDEDKPTQFGFLQLLSRLAVRYGSFVTDEAGNFDSNRFLKALEMSDAERGKAQFEHLRNKALEQIKALAGETEGGITLENIVDIHNLLEKNRVKMLNTLQAMKYSVSTSDYRVMQEAARENWGAVMKYYESAVLPQDLLMTIRDIPVRIPAAAVAEILRDEFNAGHQELLSAYLEGGETEYEYNNFKNLNPSYYGGSDVMDTGADTAYLEDDLETLSFRYPFTFGDLKKIKGISARDLDGIEAVKNEVRLTLAEDAEELLKSRLNLRVFAPGSNVGTANIGTRAMSASMDSMAVSSQVAQFSPMPIRSSAWRKETIQIEQLPIKEVQLPSPIRNLIDSPDYKVFQTRLHLSERDLMFRVIPALAREHFDEIVIDGVVDLEAVRELVLNGEEAAREREKARILKTLESQVRAYKKALQSGNPELQTAGLTGLVQYEDGRHYLKVYEPRLYRMLMEHTNAGDDRIAAAIAEEEGFDELLQAAGMNRDELLGARGSEVLRLLPSIRYELPQMIYPYYEDRILQTQAGEKASREPEYLSLPEKGINWWNYTNKYITIDAARFSFSLKDGKAEGRIQSASGVAGVQFAAQALKLLIHSNEARTAGLLRDSYLKRFIHESEAREKKLVYESLESQIEALAEALRKGDKNARAQIMAAGYVRKDDRGYYLEVPEPWELIAYLQENQTADGHLKLSAVNDALVEETNLSRQELVELPVEEIIAWLPSFKIRLQANYWPLASVDELSAGQAEPVSLPEGWRPQHDWSRYLNKMISVKGIAGYRLDGHKQLEGFINFAHSAQVLQHPAQAANILRSTPEARKAQDLRKQYENLLRNQEDPRVKQVKKAVIEDLSRSYGLDEEKVAAWVAEGKIKIKVNLEEGIAGVHFASSLQGMRIQQPLVDPLGAFVVPASIEFRFKRPERILYHRVMNTVAPAGESHSGEMVIDGPIGLPYPYPQPEYRPVILSSAAIHYDTRIRLRELNGDVFDVQRIEIQYDQNQWNNNDLLTVKMYDSTQIHCIQAPCPQGEVVKKIDYRGFTTAYECRFDEQCMIAYPAIYPPQPRKPWPLISYPQSGDITQRLVNLNSNGTLRSVLEYGEPRMVPYEKGKEIRVPSTGTLRVINEFTYNDGNTDLRKIERTGRDGVLSTITFDVLMPYPVEPVLSEESGVVAGNEAVTAEDKAGKAGGIDVVGPIYLGRLAVITLPDGTKKTLLYRSYEELLKKAREFELENQEDPREAKFKEIALANLAEITGLSKGELNSLLKDVKLNSENQVELIFKAGSMDNGRLINVTGSDEMPVSVVYNLEVIGQSFNPPSNLYGIKSAQMSWAKAKGKIKRARLSFDPNQNLQRAVYTSYMPGKNGNCTEEYCTAVYFPDVVKFLHTDYYRHAENSIEVTRAGVELLRRFNIEMQGAEVSSQALDAELPEQLESALLPPLPRSIRFRATLEKQLDQRHHLAKLASYDRQTGKLKDVTTFEYITAIPVCHEDAPADSCRGDSFLHSFERKDAEGNLLSTGKVQSSIVILTLAPGNKAEFEFSDIDELIEKARELEATTAFPLDSELALFNALTLLDYKGVNFNDDQTHNYTFRAVEEGKVAVTMIWREICPPNPGGVQCMAVTVPAEFTLSITRDSSGNLQISLSENSPEIQNLADNLIIEGDKVTFRNIATHGRVIAMREAATLIPQVQNFGVTQGDGVNAKFSGTVDGFNTEHHALLLGTGQEGEALEGNYVDITDQLDSNGSFSFEKHAGIGTHDAKLLLVDKDTLANGRFGEETRVLSRAEASFRIAGNDPLPVDDDRTSADAFRDGPRVSGKKVAARRNIAYGPARRSRVHQTGALYGARSGSPEAARLMPNPSSDRPVTVAAFMQPAVSTLRTISRAGFPFLENYYLPFGTLRDLDDENERKKRRSRR